MTEGAGQIADFSKRYRNMAYAQQRMGHTPNSMPKLDEVDDMLRQSEKIAMSLQRMRDVVFNNQQASFIEPQREQSHYRPVNGYDHDEPSPYSDEMKGGNGFTGPDPKKGQRRGVSCTFPFRPLQQLTRVARCAPWSMSQLQSSRDTRMAKRT